MIVYKFGGASVATAEAIKNVSQIILNEKTNLVVVISAMGKMTNKFEELVNAYLTNSRNTFNILSEIKTYHQDIINKLFTSKNEVNLKLNNKFTEIENILNIKPSNNFDLEYDKLVCFGEIISTIIVSEYLNKIKIKNLWIDIRNSIITDNFYRDGRIIWEITEKNIQNNFDFTSANILITQGFIASSQEGNSITLGREGSDFTASIIAYCLNAESVTIWKDVEGILNADPRIFQNTVKIDTLNYKETVELAYYGAQVIHPKTIKPLQNKNITLFVKSFIFPEKAGTIINNVKNLNILKPIIILKDNQTLISISPKDFSFIDELNISKIFNVLSTLKIKVNLMENSAVSFSIVVDSSDKITKIIENLKSTYSIKYNTNLKLITIRHYNQETISELTLNKTILVEQKTRYTARYVIQNTNNI